MPTLDTIEQIGAELEGGYRTTASSGENKWAKTVVLKTEKKG